VEAATEAEAMVGVAMEAADEEEAMEVGATEPAGLEKAKAEVMEAERAAEKAVVRAVGAREAEKVVVMAVGKRAGGATEAEVMEVGATEAADEEEAMEE
jgi:hypothetical protein